MTRDVGSQRDPDDDDGSAAEGARRSRSTPGPGAARNPRGGPQLTDRDRSILAWLGRHGIVTPEQVAAAMFRREDGGVGKWAAYRRLKKLEVLGLIRRDPTFYRRPFVLRLTAAGARVANIGLGPAKLTLADVHHSLGLVDLTESLLQEHPDAELTTERQIRAARYRELRAGGRAVGVGRTPDAILTLSTGRRVAIELDITSKRERDLRSMIAAYAIEDYSAVWWYVLPGRADRVRRVVDDEHAADFITVHEWHPR